MTITLELSPDQEQRLRAGAAQRDVQTVREVLLQAVDSTVEVLVRTSASPPEAGKLSALLDKLASELHGAPALSDDAVSRAGIYAASQNFVGQNFVEFWNVATRPVGSNGLGQTPIVADRSLRTLEQAFPRLPESSDVYGRWRGLVVRFGVSGVKVHDARLVALVLSNDIAGILTFNAADFQRYEGLGIRAVDPGEV